MPKRHGGFKRASSNKEWHIEKPDEDRPQTERETTTMVIDNHESHSEWLMLEYLHSISLWHNIIFTNVKDPKLEGSLEEAGVKAYVDRFDELAGTGRLGKHPTVCVLDPKAHVELVPEDFDSLDYIVVGGILGYAEMTGRTEALITEGLERLAQEGKIALKKRNLGKTQLSIDIAVFVAKAVYLGGKLGEIELTTELEIEHPGGSTTVLPYGYPVIDGKVIITPGLVEYLRKN